MKLLIKLFSIFIVITIYSCDKYRHHDTKTLPDGRVIKTDYNGDMNTGKFDGDIKKFYPTGELESHYIVVDGKIDGLCVYYYKTGKIKEKLHFVNGKRDGLGEFYYENGRLWTRELFPGDTLNPIKFVYFRNGRQDSIIKYNRFGVLQFQITFDSTTQYRSSVMVWPILKFPHEIHLGEKFRLEVIYPKLNSLLSIDQCNMAIITENIANIDSMKDYYLAARIKDNKWVYLLRKNKIEINKFTYTVFNIPIHDTGYIRNPVGVGEYGFTPSTAGNYCIKGVATTINDLGIENPTYRDTCISINFTVIK